MKNKILLSFLIAYATILTVISCKTQNPDPVIDLKANKIPIKDISEMQRKYKNERLAIIESDSMLKRIYGGDFKDTESIWFSLNNLKAFIKQIEYGIKTNELNIECNGLKMLLVVYPPKSDNESEYLKSIPEEYRNHLSLIMIPTYFDESTQTNESFDPFNTSGVNSGTPTKKGAAAVFGQAVSGGSQTAGNHGVVCPPNCPVKRP
jgi:hypothetical protein